MTKKQKQQIEREVLTELSIQKALAKCGISPLDYYEELSSSLEFREHFSKLAKVQNLLIYDKLSEQTREGDMTGLKIYIDKVSEMSKDLFKASDDGELDIQINTMLLIAVMRKVKKYGIDAVMNNLSKMK